MVVGEFERAFCGDQLLQLAPTFERHGVTLWLPGLGGLVDVRDPMHLSLLKLLGVHAKREVQRARFRVKAAMQTQVAEQGRTVGGRPPYGYMIVDGGPHPNKAHARWGRRLHRYAPDPVTARRCRGCSHGGSPGGASRRLRSASTSKALTPLRWSSSWGVRSRVVRDADSPAIHGGQSETLSAAGDQYGGRK